MRFELKKSKRIWLGMILSSLLLIAVWQPAGAQEGRKGLDTVIPTLGVSNVDIREVLILLSQYSGLNFTTSKEVKGTISIELSNVTVRDVLDAVLKDNGFNYIETPGGIIRVMTQRQYDYDVDYSDGGDPRRFIPRYVAVEDLEKAFRPLLSKQGKMTVVKQTNTLIVEDIPEAIARIDDHYPLIDTPTHTLDSLFPFMEGWKVIRVQRYMATFSDETGRTRRKKLAEVHNNVRIIALDLEKQSVTGEYIKDRLGRTKTITKGQGLQY